MKKQIVFFISFLFVITIAIGQNSPIILISSTGKISYMNGDKSMRIAAGAVLDPEGTVILADKATAMILCNGEYKKLSKGKNSLTKLCGGSSSSKSLNVDGKIGDFFISAVQLTSVAQGHTAGWAKLMDSKNLGGDGWGSGGKDGWGSGGKDGWGSGGKDGWGSGGKDGWGSGGKDGWGSGGKDGWGSGGKDGWGSGGKDGWGSGGKDGWGGIGNKIHLILPIGRLEAKMIHFSWSKPSNTTSYKLEIQDAAKNKIHTVTVKDTFADIDLKKLNLKKDEVYSWMVTSVENAESVSNTYQFAIETMDAKKETMAKLSKSKIYSNADHTTKSLMDAVALEMDEWYYDAGQVFENLNKNHHNNNLATMMNAAYWMRSGVTPMADAAVNK